MPLRHLLALVVLVLATGTVSPERLQGEITAEQRQEIRSLSTSLGKVSTLFGRKQFKSSAAGLVELQQKMKALADGGDEEVLQALEEVHRKLVRAHALLELEGIELPPLLELKPAEATPSAGAVSFTKDVAPLLVGKCGRCHVDQSRGEFSMATFPALMRGSTSGVVIFAGDATGSRIVEVIESGDMPRGGARVTPEELTSLKSWINAGAKFDGENPEVNLRTLAPTATNAAMPAPPVTPPTGKETVSFSRDIAPVLAESCFGCHVNSQNPRANLNMTTFQGMLRGGDNGPPIVPRQPADSLLVQRLQGEGGAARMPMGRDPLTDAVIAQFETWITEGATFDGPSADMNVAQVAAIAKAANSTHAQLSADRAELAQQNWRLGMPGTTADSFETKNFYLVGNVGTATLKEYGDKAEALAPRVAAVFGASPTEPLIKGRMTLFLFQQRFDYSEFGQMVEKRELPKEWRGHWNFTIIDAYGAMIPPRDDTYTLDGLVAQQLAGAYIASLNNPPRWFAEGAARVAAARLAPKDPRVVAWKDGLAPALAKMQKADDFLTNKLPPEDADIAAYAFVTGLMKDTKRYRAVLDGLQKGQEFDQVFAAVYGAVPAQLAELWIRSAAR